jgi:flagellar hook protein FlgE
VYYIKSGSNAWDVEVEVDGTNIGAGTLSFTTTGQLSGTTGLAGLEFTPGGGAAGPQEFDIDMTGTTQFGSDMKEIPTKADGYAVGAYVNTVIDGNGVVTNIYDNQQRIDIGKVGIAKFEALDGLSSVGNMSWVETSASGSPSINASNSDGGVEIGSLELSNVDLTAEMISLISAQHNFQANAQVEQAYNEVMQTVLKI